jgi:proline iminopeptidase
MLQFDASDGTRLSYDVRGSGPPVLVCHGGPANVFETLAASLRPLEDCCTLVYHDYRGSGRSATAPKATYTFEQIADDLNDLRVHLSYRAVVVLAHSMGGFIALNDALRHPQHCLGMVLVGTTPTMKPAKIVGPTLRALGPARTAKSLALASWYVIAWSWRRESRYKLAARYAATTVLQEGVPSVRARVRALSGPPVINDNVPQLERVLARTDLTGRLGEIQCSVLILYGSRDAMMVAGGQMLEHGLRSARAVFLLSVGHEPFIEDPSAALSAVREFLEALGPWRTAR